MSSKRLNPQALDAITSKAEVVETGAIQTIGRNERSRFRERKTYRSFSLSLAEEDYIKFNNYLDKNNIASGSAFIRELLREKGVFEG
ncbi:hypothetical protein BKH41_08780 [Helicobacter sp. 12S02232-10]|uniref:hypothetical protein n=1 Tax=Helicobacter sp. 12S02232-10 TaxID=1476197 RepID=UPI000BA6E550|nr:hypothetical protein [Helicobacter sp. 12S02232-10]PAF46589.1 hypothetical protein BKH41_08780 [Helicobacter sp. 12S02232-10]